MTATRRMTLVDRLLLEAQRALDTSLGPARAGRANPADAAAGPDLVELALDDPDRLHAAGLMRVNHTGEVCAQALYLGQAAVARDPATRSQLLDAAQEETDHLAWCADRLRELDSRPSLFNPLWYAGSYAIGAAAGRHPPERRRPKGGCPPPARLAGPGPPPPDGVPAGLVVAAPGRPLPGLSWVTPASGRSRRPRSGPRRPSVPATRCR
jgi:hypothetical protein